MRVVVVVAAMRLVATPTRWCRDASSSSSRRCARAVRARANGDGVGSQDGREARDTRRASTSATRLKAEERHAETIRANIEADRAPERACVGRCVRCEGEEHALPRTREAERAAAEVCERVRESGRLDYDADVADERFNAKYLDEPEGGKMIGALVGTDSRTGERVTLKAFSGQLFGAWRVDGWAPPVGSLTHDTPRYAEEHAKIKSLSAEIERKQREEKALRAEIRELATRADEQVAAIAAEVKKEKAARQTARMEAEDETVIDALDEASRASKRRLAQLKRARDATVAPKLADVATLREEINALKTTRKGLSHALQDEIWDSYELPSLAGDVIPLRDAFHPPVDALPCGCGDCAAPKLLAWAHHRGVVPHSIAEVWLGASRTRDFRVEGVFYGACREKCVPIMAHLLCPKPLIDVRRRS